MTSTANRCLILSSLKKGRSPIPSSLLRASRNNGLRGLVEVFGPVRARAGGQRLSGHQSRHPEAPAIVRGKYGALPPSEDGRKPSGMNLLAHKLCRFPSGGVATPNSRQAHGGFIFWRGIPRPPRLNQEELKQ
jgi:hypothetical protein